MGYITAIKRYSKDTAADLFKFGCYMASPVSQRTAVMATWAFTVGVILLNIGIAFAASTPLFVQLMSAFQLLLEDVQEIVLTVVTLSISLCLVGLMFAPFVSSRGVAGIVTMLRTVILAYVFFLLVPAILSTLSQVFEGGASGGTGGTGAGSESGVSEA